MARINIEESIFKDPRFIDYCIEIGNRNEALGSLVMFWMIAQKFYIKFGEIPYEEFLKYKLDEKLIKCGLAERSSTGVRAKGQNDQFSWLLQAQQAGRASAVKRGNAQPRKPRTAVRKNSNDRSTGVDGPSTSLLSSHYSLLNTHLILDDDVKSPSSKEYRKAFEDGYESRYGVKPVWNAQNNSQFSRFCKSVPSDRIPDLIHFYLNHNASWYIQQAHSVGALLRDCTKLHTEMMSGMKITSIGARQAEKIENDAQTIKRLMENTNEQRSNISLHRNEQGVSEADLGRVIRNLSKKP